MQIISSRSGASIHRGGPPVRVLHLLPQLRMGGMEHGVVKLLNGLPADVVDGRVCSFEAITDSILDRLDAGIRVDILGRRPGNDPALVWRLARLLRRAAPDIVHSHSWGTLVEGYIASCLAGVPHFVHGEHGTMELRPRNLRVQRWLWGRADRVLSVSSRLADRMARETGFPRERLHVIRNGADLDRFNRVSRAEARRALDLAADAFVVGTVGRLVPVKDHETLLSAVGRMHADGLPATTVFIGDGPLRASLERSAEAKQIGAAVRFLGHRADVERLLPALDLFVLTSTSEGLPNTVLEAMASGLPVVSTHVGGVDELVEAGRSGLLVPSGDPVRLADAMASLARDPQRRLAMARRGLEKATSEFGLARMLADYEQLYLNVAARRALRVAAL